MPPKVIESLTHSQILTALDQILASDVFAGVERPSRFLRHLVDTALAGKDALLKESVLGHEVFGQAASWDPRSNPIVRQEASRLRKRLARYYSDAAPEVQIELPIGTYVPVFRRVPTKSSIREEEPSVKSTVEPIRVVPEPALPLAALRPGWMRWGAVVLLAISLGTGAYLLRSSLTKSAASLAVLPFTSVNADPANRYLAEGFTEDVTEGLARLESLRVTARASMSTLRGKRNDPYQVGRRLNVTHVLDGSVERIGERIRVMAHLVRVADGSQVWSQTFDRPLKELSAVQADLTDAVRHNLNLAPDTPRGKRHVPQPEAYELLLHASFLSQDLTPASLNKARQDLERAVQLDPEYAEAWYRLGTVRTNLSGAAGRNPTQDEFNQVRGLFQRSLTLDSNLSGAHASLALIEMRSDWNWAGAERELRLAMRGESSASAEGTYGLLLSYRGRFQEADVHMAKALALDPLSSVTLLQIASVRYWEGRYSQAIAICQQILEQFPNQLNPQIGMIQANTLSGEKEKGLALQQARTMEAKFGPGRIFTAAALAHLGHRQESIRLLHQLEQEYGTNTAVYRQWFALAWAAVGDRAETIKWLERSADLREYQVLNLAVNPAFADMRYDDAFRKLVNRIGLK